jgi:hypothetical protein
MVTKGYQKGVYDWVTKGIRGSSASGAMSCGSNINVLWRPATRRSIFPRPNLETPQAGGACIYDLDQNHPDF